MANLVLQRKKPSKAVPLEEIFLSRGRIKILQILAKANELNISQIAKDANLNHNSVKYHLAALTAAGILQEKIFGRVKIYRFRLEDLKVRAIKQLFELWADPRLSENFSRRITTKLWNSGFHY